MAADASTPPRTSQGWMHTLCSMACRGPKAVKVLDSWICRDMPQRPLQRRKIAHRGMMTRPKTPDRAENREIMTEEVICATFAHTTRCHVMHMRRSERCLGAGHGLMPKEIRSGSRRETRRSLIVQVAKKDSKVLSRTRQAGKCSLSLQLVKL